MGGGTQDFEVVCKLGLGAYGSVYKAVRRVDGGTYAIKRVKLEGLDQQDLAMTLNEIRLLASFRHPRIVRLHETFLDGRGGPTQPLHLCVVMEYCGFQDLERKIRRYRARGEHVDERVVWVYLVQTLEALQALHSLKILHRDIKPANILLDEEGNAKLGDLNVSRCVDDGGAVQTVVGTLPYMAPEIWRGEAYAFPADLYALGCTLFELAALLPPFDGVGALQLQRAVLRRKFQAEIPAGVYSQDLRDVVLLIMHPDPKARLTAEKLLALPQVAARLCLVRHQLPTDLPPPTPLTPCAPIDQATVTLAELPTLLPALLPAPSYPPPPVPTPLEEASSPSPSPSPPPSPPPHPHPNRRKEKKRERARKKKQAAVQEALLLRGASEVDAAAAVAARAAVDGLEGSPSSLRALLKSPYPDASSPVVVDHGASPKAAGQEEQPQSPPRSPPPEPQQQPEQPALLTQTRRTRRPPSLPKARLNALGLGGSEQAAGTDAGMGTLPAVAVTVITAPGGGGGAAAEAAVEEGDAPWERVPTPTSFAVPLPSPSPASPYQLPPELLALSPAVEAGLLPPPPPPGKAEEAAAAAGEGRLAAGAPPVIAESGAGELL